MIYHLSESNNGFMVEIETKRNGQIVFYLDVYRYSTYLLRLSKEKQTEFITFMTNLSDINELFLDTNPSCLTKSEDFVEDILNNVIKNWNFILTEKKISYV